MRTFLPFILSFIACYAIIYASKRFSIAEKPRGDRWHTEQTPKFGGVAIFLSFIICIYINNLLSDYVINLLLICTLMFLIGIYDDIFIIKPIPKMLTIILVGIFCFYTGIKFYHSGPIWLSLPLTILWYAGIVNATNIIDNMDGLSAGTSIITLSLIIYFSFNSGQFEIFDLSLILIFACLGFLVLNFHPAKIFMGDSGSLFLGCILATFSLEIAASSGKNILAAFMFPVLLMAYPIFDTFLVTINRLRYKIPISQGGKDHSSHRLAMLGISQRKTVALIYLISLSFGMIAVAINSLNIRVAFSLIIIFVIGLIVFGIFMSSYGYTSEKARLLKIEDANIINKNIYLNKKQLLELILDALLVVSSFTISHYLRFEQNTNNTIWELHDNLLPFVIVIKLLIFFYFDIYRSYWEYVSIPDIINIFKASVVSTLLLVFIIFISQTTFYSRSVFFIDCIITFLSISLLRFFYRLFINLIKKTPHSFEDERILIIGSEDLGQLITRFIINSSKYLSKPIGIINANNKSIGKRLHGIPIIGSIDHANELIIRKNISYVIMTLNSSFQKTKNIKKFCKKNGIKYKNANFELE